MIWVFGSLAVLAVYLVTGWRLAVRDLQNAWQRARHEWGSCQDLISSSVKEQTISMLLFWPVLIPWRAVSRSLGQITELGDPVELARQVRERDRHIADLERELGIGK